MKFIYSLALVLFSFATMCIAQTDSTGMEDLGDFDFDDFGDADDTKVKTYCTQKVLYLSPTQLISIGYEGQGGFDFTSDPRSEVNGIARTGGLKMAFNAPVISRNDFILNLGLTFWQTNFTNQSTNNDPLFWSGLNSGLNTTGFNATAFKPLNNKNFIILQASADANGNHTGFEDLNLGKALTYSATGIYGWKKDENTMFGVGATRTYRAGQVLHIPVLFYNKTWNPKWGLESILPARVHLRRNFGTNGMLLAGYEIEGNTFYLGSNDSNGSDYFLRRGELKPRINYQRQVKNFIWVSAQAGLRYNWRFDVFTTQNPVKDEVPALVNTLGNPFYFNISLNLVSP